MPFLMRLARRGLRLPTLTLMELLKEFLTSRDARERLKEAYTNFVEYDHPLQRVNRRVNLENRSAILRSIVELPGGYDILLAIGRHESPDVDLPFRNIFLEADPSSFSDEVRQVVVASVGENLIPQYVAEHKETLLLEAASVSVPRGERMPGLLELYQRVGIDDYEWTGYGPATEEMEWSYDSFDPPEPWLRDDDRLGRYREATFPDGVDDWYRPEFDTEAAGWGRGLAPFGAADGKLERFTGSSNCTLSFCGCHKPLNTLWEKDVLLIQGDFEIPPFEEGCRYRLLHGGISHVGSGGGYRIHVNGKLFHEQEVGVRRRESGVPIGKVIPKEWWPEFVGGEVHLAAINFKKHHPRTGKYGGNMSFFIERMKVPSID